MKYSLYLVSALLLISCVSGGGYNHHHSRPKELVLDDLANELLQFGINFIFQTAADQYGVSTDGVEVTRINHVRWFPIDNPITLYKFNVDAANSDGDRVWTWFEVKYNRDTREMTMGRWRYEVYFNMNFEGFLNEEASLESAIDEGQVGGGGSEVEGETEQDIETEVETGVEIETGVNEEGTVANNEDFEEVPQDEIENDPVIQDVLDNGAAFIFNRAANRFGASNDNVEVTNVNSVFRKADDENNRTIYRIHFEATNNDGTTVEARLFVDHNNETGENNVVGHWRYLIQFGVSGNEEGSLLEEESILEFDMNDGLDDVL